MSIEVLDEKSELYDPWLQPYVEHRILAGFLTDEDVVKVQPASGRWPTDVSDRVRALHGAARNLPTRPEAGQCRLFPVEEPEALAVLQNASQMLPLGPGVPVSYSWVEISNLIATASIADALPRDNLVFNDAPLAMAEYSLLGPAPTLHLTPTGLLCCSSAVNIQTLPGELQGDRLIFGCRISLPARPILVGYEQERFYLLNQYGRVLQALIGNIDRLLCLVHYGLNLAAPHLGVRLIDPKSGAVNHFGRGLLSCNKPPLVKDFLDPSLSAVFPARAPFFIVTPSIQANQVQFTAPPSAQLPLTISAER